MNKAALVCFSTTHQYVVTILLIRKTQRMSSQRVVIDENRIKLYGEEAGYRNPTFRKNNLPVLRHTLMLCCYTEKRGSRLDCVITTLSKLHVTLRRAKMF